MKALVKTAAGAGHLALEDRPTPQAGSGQILIRVRAAGICGTDLHIRAGEYPCTPPVVLGHEVCGTVEAVGAGVDGLRPGDAVVTETYAHVCGHCHYCTTGRQNLCAQRRSIGSGADGGMAEYVAVPAHRVQPLPKRLSIEEGAANEPYICCVQAVFGKVCLRPGDPVLVSGPGIMGLFCAQLLHLMGCRVLVTGTPRSVKRLDLAKRLGADETLFSDREDLTAQIHAFSGGLGVAASFECSGAQTSVTTCLDGLRKGGTMVQVALPGGPSSIDLTALALGEKHITGSFATLPVWWEKGLQLLEDHPELAIRPMISGVYPLEQWEEGFSMASSRNGLKYVLTP